MKHFLTNIPKGGRIAKNILFASHTIRYTLLCVISYSLLILSGCQSNDEKISQLYRTGRNHWLAQQPDSAAFYYAEAEKLITGCTAPLLQAKVYFEMGSLVQRIQDYEGATAYFQKAFEAYRQAGNKRMQAYVLTEIGNDYLWADESNTSAALRHYRDALASFARFRGGEDIMTEDLDAETMSRYEAWLKGRGVKRNSSSCYLRTLRTLYRKAVDMGLTADRGIFRHVFTGFAKTAKRAVTIDSIRAIRRLALGEGSPLAFARDMFMLSVYLQGMSFIDMAYLKKTDIRNGLLQYSRKKTGQTLAVRWEGAMQDVVDSYAGLAAGSPYLLPIITRQDGTERRQYERMEHNVNRNLKKIGEMAGLHMPLTTYVARHTWASAMRDMGYDLSIVSRGLGHESLKTTQIYLSSIDTAAVAMANRSMIGRIVGKRAGKDTPPER